MSDDPFAPINNQKKPRLRVVASTSDLTPVMPIPADAPSPPTHPLGAPTATWIYRDAEGRELGRALRFDPNGRKEFRPLTLWHKGPATPTWRWQLWPEPRPLYGLHALAQRPNAPVVVVEGEKAADAAAQLLPAHVVVTHPGGSNAPAKADWSPLRGRSVTIWPDADAPGLKCAATVAARALEAGAAAVSIATPPAGAADGWDAADAKAEGWTVAQAQALISAARPHGTPAKGEPAAAAEGKAARRGAASLLDLVDRHSRNLFHDASGLTYAAVAVGDHIENLGIQSKAFANWLSMAAYAEGMTPPNKATLGDAQRVLEARAMSEGEEKQPFRRVGGSGQTIYINMADKPWRVIEITPKGWTVLRTHDLPNVRSAAMQPLLEPQATDEGIEIPRRFVNTSEDGFKLVVAWLLSVLYPFGPFPVLALNGEQGSAKSTMTRLLRNLVDPNFAPLRAMPKEENDLLIAATHAHVLALDNVSSISPDMSGALCRIVTGGGISARAKFTDGDEFVAYAKAPVILNGITTLAGRPDLASRALIVQLDPIPDDVRLTEDEVEAEWKLVAPRVLAILLDTIAAALARLPTTRPPKVSRMADFERFIEAASPFLGWPPGEFAAIYRDNQAEADAAIVEQEPLAVAIIDMLAQDHPQGWEGTPTRLLEILSAKVTDSVRRSRMWPATAGGLGMRVKRLRPVLRRRGIDVLQHHSGDRRIRIVSTAAP